MKTSELEGAELNYWVAKAEGKDAEVRPTWSMFDFPVCIVFRGKRKDDGHYPFSPSTDWGQGGKIIERERIQLRPCVGSDDWDSFYLISKYKYGGRAIGSTLLIAAMRAYVASKFGDEVEMDGK